MKFIINRPNKLQKYKEKNSRRPWEKNMYSL